MNNQKVAMGYIIILLVSVLVLSACGSPALSDAEIQQTAIAEALNSLQAATPENLSLAEPIPPTPTQAPPTLTPAPTNTPVPTFTNTPEPQPIVLTGSGDAIVDLNKWDGPAVLKPSYSSGGNFAIINYGADNERIDLLVNTIGAYTGTIFFDLGENTTRFEVKASGPWQLTIQPFTPDYVRSVQAPGTIQGIGDDVIVIKSELTPDTLIVDASTANSNFAIICVGLSGRDLLINEIAPYSGTVLIPKDPFFLKITAEGNWQIEVTTR